MALTKAERKRAADLIQKVLEMVDDSDLAADGPAGVALVRRLEGAMLALTAMDGTMTAGIQTEKDGRPRVPGSS